MAKAAKTLGLTLIWLIVFDVAVAFVLSLNIGPLDPLARYFHLGRSVPGKLGFGKRQPVFQLFHGMAQPDMIACIGLGPCDAPEYRHSEIFRDIPLCPFCPFVDLGAFSRILGPE